MAQLPEESNFTQNSLAIGLVIENIIHFLDGYPLSCGKLDGLGNLAVASRS